jgi:DNA repair photolyase
MFKTENLPGLFHWKQNYSEKSGYVHAYNIGMIIKEIYAKSILSVSKIYPYVINPYTGCSHSCSYCYASFMKRFTGHKEPWGDFVDVKVNAADLLQQEIVKKKMDRVWVSGVCDPYQPLEEKYRLTRQCLEILALHDWPVSVQTRSPLVLRDIDVLQKGKHFQVGCSITTADDSIRRIFEPSAPPIAERVRALDELHRAGIKTYVMIAPLLPGAEDLADLLADKIDSVLIDRMNYNNADSIYRKHGLEKFKTGEYYEGAAKVLSTAFMKMGVPVQMVG